MTDTEQTFIRPAYQERSRKQRDRLLKAGERVFAQSGFWQAHITEIAKRAGCSVGSFYRRFPDKEALFFALQADMAARAEVNIKRFFADPSRNDESVREVIHRLVHNTVRTMKGIEGYYRALFELSLRGHNVWPLMRQLESIEADLLLELLRSRSVNVETMTKTNAHLMIRMMHGQIISVLLHGPGPFKVDDLQLQEELAAMLLRYLGVDNTDR